MRNHQIFTPENIVEKMIDMSGFFGPEKVWEPSFGNGNFLVALVRRVLESGHPEYLDNIYGCEIDKTLYDTAVKRLNSILYEYGISYSWPNLKHCNAFEYPYFNMDIVIGNPPYVRIHDMDETERKLIESLRFSNGMNDLYISFFELGLNHLKDDGVLVYITPNSYLKNTSQKAFREYVAPMISNIIDYGSFKVFDPVMTYTCITMMKKNYRGTTKYTKMCNFDTIEWSCNTDLVHMGFTFVKPDDEEFLRRVTSGPVSLGDMADIRYGIATNADSIFLNQDVTLEPCILRQAVKASTLQFQTILYPYIRDTEVIPEDIMQRQYPAAYKYLLSNKTKLEKRDMDGDGPFYRYARTQGLKDINHPKLAVQNIVSNEAERCRLVEVPAEALIYSGIMVIPRDNLYFSVIEILKSKDFCRYIRLIGKDMSGGYKSFTTKDIKRYTPECKII